MNAFWQIVASNAIVATGLAIFALILGRFWKNAAAVHALWAVVLLKLFTPPLFTAVLPFASTFAPPAASVGMPDKASDSPATREVGRRLPVAVADARVAPAASDPPHTTWHRSVTTFALKSWSLFNIVAAFWACGSCGAALVYAIRIRRFADGIRHFEEAPPAIRMMVAQLSGRLGLRRTPVALMTSHAIPPLVWSLGTPPRVILPSGLFAQLGREAQTTIVAHELVHIRRGDHLIRLLELAATTVFWWHPVVWLARRQLRELEEQCCDGRVLELLPDHPRTYAAALVDTLEYLAGRTRPSVPLRTAIHSTHSLTRRITMLAQPRPNRLSALSAALIIALVAVPLAFAFAVNPKPTGNTAQEVQQPVGATVAVLRGRVTDEKGGPLADVRVRVAIPAADMRYVNSTTQPKPLEARSDANGDYRLELPGIAGRTTISIDAMKPGYGRLVGTIMGGGDARRVEVEPGKAAEASLVLNPARYFRGVVVDEQGQPIPGVDVVATLKFGRGMAYVEATETDPDGSFELFNYPIGPIMIGDENEASKGVVQFSDPNYVDQKFEGLDSLDRVQGGAMRIVLKTGYKVTGTVVDVAGKPVPNAMVKAVLADAKVGQDETHRKATLTDANGKFALYGLSEGLTMLDARALKIKQKIVTPLLKMDRDKNVEIQLQPIALPADLKKYVVLGMELADVTPELKSAYDLYHDRGALILDPGKDYERLSIGQIAEGYEFWMVGEKRIGGLRDFVDQILAEIGDRDADESSVRVVYTFNTPEAEGTNTQYMKLTKNDLKQLRAVSERLAADAR